MNNEEIIVELKKGNTEPIKNRIMELRNLGLNEDAAIIIALGERKGK